MNKDSVITLTNIEKYYDKTAALTGVSFKLEKKEALALLGPNGAGKTTLLRIISGFIIPSAGDVTIADYDITENPIEIKKRIGYLPEIPPLYGDMTVREYLLYVGNLKAIRKHDLNARLNLVLDRTALEEVSERFIKELSLGYKKRVGIAGAIIHNPEIVILDEPISGLDPRQIIEMRNLINELKKDHSIIISSHILSEVAKTCDRFIFLDKGRIQKEETRKNFLEKVDKLAHYDITLQTSMPTNELKTFLEKLNGVSELKVQSSEANKYSFQLDADSNSKWKKNFLSFVSTNDIELISFSPRSLDLETLFMELSL